MCYNLGMFLRMRFVGVYCNLPLINCFYVKAYAFFKFIFLFYLYYNYVPNIYLLLILCTYY